MKPRIERVKEPGTEPTEEPTGEPLAEPVQEPVAEPAKDHDCGCNQHGDPVKVRMRHPNLKQEIEVFEVSVPNWEKTGWEIVKP